MFHQVLRKVLQHECAIVKCVFAQIAAAGAARVIQHAAEVHAGARNRRDRAAIDCAGKGLAVVTAGDPLVFSKILKLHRLVLLL